jgi:hypothetical protein
MKFQTGKIYPDVGISSPKRSDHLSDVIVHYGDGLVLFPDYPQTASVRTQHGDTKLDRRKHTGQNLPEFLSLCQL